VQNLGRLPSTLPAGLLIGGSLLLALTMFLPWFDFGSGTSYSFWEASSGADVALLLLVLATAGASAALLAIGLPALGAVAAAIGLAEAGLAGGYVIESLFGGDFGVGAFFGGAGALVVAAGAALLLVLPAITRPGALEATGGALGDVLKRQPDWNPGAASPTAAPAAPAAPPAGWYANPAGGAGERYWDGTTWTDQMRGA
jgi:hypothetical protein